MAIPARRRFALAVLVTALLAACAPASSPASVGPSGLPSPAPSSSAAPDASAGPTIGPPSPSPVAFGSPSSGGPAIPDFSHITLIVFENKEASAVIGNSAAPYFNHLASTYGLATNETAVGHPSQPNYLALASGSTDGVTDDGLHDLNERSVFDEIEASGRTWQVAAQNDHPGCFTGALASGGPDGPGTYARKHNPAISFTAISRHPARCARIGDLHGFDPAAAAFSWVVPNLCNSMHDCSTATGDAWLASFLPAVLANPAYQNNGLVLITFDEGSTGVGGGGRVATIVISPLGKPAFRSGIAHDHYSLLHTIQVAWGLPCLAHACAANDLREFFR